MGARNQGGTDSRLLSWINAESACNEVWDIFATEVVRAIDARIVSVQASASTNPLDPHPQDEQTQITLEQLRICKQRIPETFQAERERGLADLKNKLLPQRGKKRKLGPVYTRGTVTAQAPKPRKKKGKKHRGNNRPRHGRSHHKGRYVLTHPRNHVRGRRLLTARERREAERKKRRDARARHRATNLIRRLRGWKPYVRHRTVANLLSRLFR